MIVAGIDVGKAALEVSVAEGPVIRLDNTVEGISKLLRHLAEQDATVAVCEGASLLQRGSPLSLLHRPSDNEARTKS